MPKGLGTQIVAGILGLLFVIGLVLLGRRLGQDLRERFLASRGKVQNEKISPTPPLNKLVGLSPTPKEISQKGDILTTQTVSSTKGGLQEIPRTGAESLLLTSFLLPAGYYLRKRN